MREMLSKIDDEINTLRLLMYEAMNKSNDLTKPEVLKISQELDGKITLYQKMLYNK